MEAPEHRIYKNVIRDKSLKIKSLLEMIIIGTDTYFSWTSLPRSLIILLSLLIF